MARKIFRIPELLAEDIKKYHKEFGMSVLAEDGMEYPSSERMFVVGEEGAPTLKERVQRILRPMVDNILSSQGGETFEEANDFEIEDYEEFTSPYETPIFDMVEENIPSREINEAEPVNSTKAEPETRLHFDGNDYTLDEKGDYIKVKQPKSAEKSSPGTKNMANSVD